MDKGWRGEAGIEPVLTFFWQEEVNFSWYCMDVLCGRLLSKKQQT